MSRALEVPPLGFTDLPVEEQIDYVQALWDVIAALIQGMCPFQGDIGKFWMHGCGV
jgi:hypothetical protein